MKVRDSDGPALFAEVQRTATRAGRRQTGRFSLEGDRLHERALRAGASIEAVLISRAYRGDSSLRRRSLLRELERRECTVVVANDDWMVDLTEGRDIGEIVGLCTMPPPPRLDDLLGAVPSAPSGLIVACDIEEPGNVGALVRTALASGSPALVALGKSDPYHPKAVRTSMGAIFRLPVLHYAAVDRLFVDFERHGIEPLAAVSHGGTPLPELDLRTDVVAFLVGSESCGLPENLVAGVARQVTIPMIEEVDSLSVNAVAAVLLYEVRRRRQPSGEPPCAGPIGAVR